MGLGCGIGKSLKIGKPDVAETTDKDTEAIASVLIAMLLLGPALLVMFFMGLFVMSNIETISPLAIIGLIFWVCCRYGSKNSILNRFRYRITKAQRATILRRLSGINQKG